ncbi:DUF6531 domain-containing protein [Chitinimonas sp. PSY-7]|uniref:DUF6531 domain-containing protein n=1 Tax=Chitinimonas sp. PSY-7 TaxID=3459088 RepID=UPI00403FD6F3
MANRPPDPGNTYLYKPNWWYTYLGGECSGPTPAAAFSGKCDEVINDPNFSWGAWEYVRGGWQAFQPGCHKGECSAASYGSRVANGACAKGWIYDAVFKNGNSGDVVSVCTRPKNASCVAPKEDFGNGCVCPEGMINDGEGCKVDFLAYNPVNYGNKCSNAQDNRSTTASSSTSSAPVVPECGNPIQPATGNKYQREVDYQGVGANRLAVVRHYNSLADGWRDPVIPPFLRGVRSSAMRPWPAAVLG